MKTLLDFSLPTLLLEDALPECEYVEMKVGKLEEVRAKVQAQLLSLFSRSDIRRISFYNRYGDRIGRIYTIGGDREIEDNHIVKSGEAVRVFAIAEVRTNAWHGHKHFVFRIDIEPSADADDTGEKPKVQTATVGGGQTGTSLGSSELFNVKLQEGLFS